MVNLDASAKFLKEGLTFDDVSADSGRKQNPSGGYRSAHQLTQKIQLNIPVMSAAMDTVTEYRMAIAIAREGGIGIIHKNMSIAAQAEQVDMVKRSENGVITNPFWLAPATPWVRQTPSWPSTTSPACPSATRASSSVSSPTVT